MSLRDLASDSAARQGFVVDVLFSKGEAAARRGGEEEPAAGV
jgi:hypothetical protein